MKLLVGLGNIGEPYRQTRHNLGFMVLDRLVDQQTWPRPGTQSNFFGQIAQIATPENQLILLKPSTMMNLSGKAVAATAAYYRVPVDSVWVIYDDLDLAFGTLRTRHGGGSGGHNGVSSIIKALGPDFGRIRVGIGRPASTVDAADFVLSRFTPDEAKLLPALIDRAAQLTHNLLLRQYLPIHTANLLSDNSDPPAAHK
jgi:peptidyl-tRNA hydrolase, PTH1 family